MDSGPPRLTAALSFAAVGMAVVIGIAWPGPGADVLPPTATPLLPAGLPFTPTTVGAGPRDRPLITHVQVADLDGDRLPDVLACDAQTGRVVWCRQHPRGTWTERALGDVELAAPCHADLADLDGDGDTDIAVAVLGNVYPTNDRVGRVVWLENRDGSFATHVVLDDVRRVADVRAGDLNGDGRVDLAVAEFGYDQGNVYWLENKGGTPPRFEDHLLLAAPGTVHVPVADFDGDGDLDVVALVSQDAEEIWAFENTDGKFTPRPRVLHSPLNFDLGSAGLVVADLDRDGKPDLIRSAGDNLEVRTPHPQPWHGVTWFRNLGGWRFEEHELAKLGGAYAAAAGDIDGDGDTDVAAVSMFNDWRRPGAASAVWLENDGAQNFRARLIAERPTHLATVACGDLDGDGRADVVAGGFHILEPFDRLGRITLWRSGP